MEDFNNNNAEDILEFDVNTILMSEILHIIGAPGGGKTHLILFLMYIFKHKYAASVVYCATELSQGAFTPFIGGAFVSDTYSEHDHKRNISRQVLCSKEKCNYKEIISVIDDFGFNKKASKSECIINSHKNGSQWFHELQMMGYQSINDIPEELKNCASKVFVFYEKEDSNRRRLHKAYFKVFLPEYKDFCQLMNDICQKHVCLVVDLKKQSSVLSECVYYFKAPFWVWKHSDDPTKKRPYPEGARFGCQQFIEWSDQRFDKNAVPDFVKEMTAF